MILFLMKLCLIIYYCPIICTFYLTEWKFIYSVFFFVNKAQHAPTVLFAEFSKLVK